MPPFEQPVITTTKLILMVVTGLLSFASGGRRLFQACSLFPCRDVTQDLSSPTRPAPHFPARFERSELEKLSSSLDHILLRHGHHVLIIRVDRPLSPSPHRLRTCPYAEAGC